MNVIPIPKSVNTIWPFKNGILESHAACEGAKIEGVTGKTGVGAAQHVQRPRDLSFDALRGLAIFLVVLSHAGVIGWYFKDAETGVWNFYYSMFVRQMVMCTIPIFLAVSGYWLAGARCESWADYRAFVKKRVTRIFIPYLFWSFFFYGIIVLRGQPHSLSDLIYKLLTGGVEGNYFFLLMLLQFYLLTPLFIRLAKVRGATALVVLVHVLFVAFIYALRFGYNKDIPFAYVKIPFVSWLCCFYVGVIYRLHPDFLSRSSVWWFAVSAPLLLLLSLVEGGLLTRYDYFEFAINDIKYSTLLYAIAVILLLFKIRLRVNWPPLLVFLGNYSFGIYFTHGFIMRGIHKVLLSRMPLVYNVQPVYQAILTVATFVVCCVVIYVTRKSIGKERAERLMGF